MAPTSAPAGARRDTTLDVLRTLATLGVVATHARWLAHVPSGRTSSWWDAMHASLWQGTRTTVYLFFALSGFLIARPYVGALLDGTALPSPRAYGLRRLARIVPAWWVAFTAFLVLGFGPASHLLSVVDHYLLIHNEVPGDAGTMLPVAWTLGIEASFYLAVPVVAALVRRLTPNPVAVRRLLAGLGGLTLGSAVVHAAVFTRSGPTGWDTVAQYSLPAQFLFFAPGVALAVAEHGRPPVELARPARVVGAGVAAVAWFGCMYLFGVSTGPVAFSSFGFALVSGLIVWLARRSPAPRSAVGRAAVWLGTISYGLYLWHWIVMRAIYGVWGAAFAGTGTVSWPLATLVVFGLTVPVAAASWYLLERPLMGLAARHVRPSAVGPRAVAGGSGAASPTTLPATPGRPTGLLPVANGDV